MVLQVRCDKGHSYIQADIESECPTIFIRCPECRKERHSRIENSQIPCKVVIGSSDMRVTREELVAFWERASYVVSKLLENYTNLEYGPDIPVQHVGEDWDEGILDCEWSIDLGTFLGRESFSWGDEEWVQNSREIRKKIIKV